MTGSGRSLQQLPVGGECGSPRSNPKDISRIIIANDAVPRVAYWAAVLHVAHGTRPKIAAVCHNRYRHMLVEYILLATPQPLAPTYKRWRCSVVTVTAPAAAQTASPNTVWPRPPVIHAMPYRSNTASTAMDSMGSPQITARKQKPYHGWYLPDHCVDGPAP